MCSKNRRDEELILNSNEVKESNKLYEKALDVIIGSEDGCPIDFEMTNVEPCIPGESSCRKCWDDAIRENVKGGG